MVKRSIPQTGRSKPAKILRRHTGKSRDTRLHTRRACSVATHFAADRQLFEGTIENLSAGGTYIKVKGRFIIGDDIIVAGPFATNHEEVKRRGKIVRLGPQGIGVRFVQ